MEHHMHYKRFENRFYWHTTKSIHIDQVWYSNGYYCYLSINRICVKNTHTLIDQIGKPKFYYPKLNLPNAMLENLKRSNELGFIDKQSRLSVWSCFQPVEWKIPLVWHWYEKWCFYHSGEKITKTTCMKKEVRSESKKERKMRKMSKIQQQHLSAFRFLPHCKCEAWPILYHEKEKRKKRSMTTNTTNEIHKTVIKRKRLGATNHIGSSQHWHYSERTVWIHYDCVECISLATKNRLARKYCRRVLLNKWLHTTPKN